jgi:hypothetical protein
MVDVTVRKVKSSVGLSGDMQDIALRYAVTFLLKTLAITKQRQNRLSVPKFPKAAAPVPPIKFDAA